MRLSWVRHAQDGWAQLWPHQPHDCGARGNPQLHQPWAAPGLAASTGASNVLKALTGRKLKLSWDELMRTGKAGKLSGHSPFHGSPYTTRLHDSLGNVQFKTRWWDFYSRSLYLLTFIISKLTTNTTIFMLFLGFFLNITLQAPWFLILCVPAKKSHFGWLVSLMQSDLTSSLVSLMGGYFSPNFRKLHALSSKSKSSCVNFWTYQYYKL